jgi:soluble cytochrome b562
MPRERQRVRQFALALDGGTVDETSVVPLTRLADSLHGVGTAMNTAPSDTFKLALRNRLLAVGAVSAPAGGLTSPAPWRRRLVAASAVLAISTGSGASLAIASSDALPGDRLYEVKLAIENVRLALAPDDVTKAERYLAIASTRLTEINAMLASNPNASADPALVQELRETMAAMAEAVAAGSALFFEIYERTGDESVLITLEQFLAERALGLSAVRDLMPIELRRNQASLMVELEGLAAKVAYVTGRTPELVPTTLVKDKERAGRHQERTLLADSAAAVTAAIEAMRAAAEAAQQQTAEAAAQQPAPAAEREHQATPESVQRDVSKYVEINVTGQDGSVDHVAVATMPNSEHAREFNTGSLKGSPAQAGGSASNQLLWSLPVPTNDVGASVPGSLSASFSPTGARYAHVAAE